MSIKKPASTPTIAFCPIPLQATVLAAESSFPAVRTLPGRDEGAWEQSGQPGHRSRRARDDAVACRGILLRTRRRTVAALHWSAGVACDVSGESTTRRLALPP